MNLDNPSINASFETLAAFWPPASPALVMPGVLSSKKGLLHFVTAPTYEHLNQDQIRKSFQNLGHSLGGDREITDCLTGRTREGKCTLFWLFPLSNPGVLDFSTSERIDSTRYRVGAAVTGLQLAGPDSPEIESAAFRFTGIHKWMPTPWDTNWTDTHVVHRIPFEPVEVFRFTSLELVAEISCEIRTDGSSTAKGRTIIDPMPLIRIRPRELRSFSWFAELIPRIENFFSLLLGTSITPKQIALFAAKDTGYLVQKRPRKKEKPNRQLWIACPPFVVAQALSNWLAVPDGEQAIEKIVLGNIRKSELFLETEFLGVAQGLEAFGRIHFKERLPPRGEFRVGLQKISSFIAEVWGDSSLSKRATQLLNHADEISYAERLRLIWNMLDPDFAVNLFGQQEAFIKSIVHTRNYFTHLGSSSTKYVVQGSHELFLLNQKMHALLRSAMLNNLGIPEEYLRDPISYQTTRWK